MGSVIRLPMGCCGDKGDDLLHPPPTASDDDPDPAVLSPMNSNFFALASLDIARSIFERLPLPDLARAACVCRLWSSVAGNREMRARAFGLPWKLKRVVGDPASAGFWRDRGLGKFAISHRLLRGDTVAGLAVRYSVQVMDIKRLNNMMSDHGIYSRDRLLIPISRPEVLQNMTCYIEMDMYAKREVAVLYLDDMPERERRNRNLASGTNNRGKKRIVDSVKRSMQVDDGTAQYYLSISNGDPKAAILEFSEDLRWERQLQKPE